VRPLSEWIDEGFEVDHSNSFDRYEGIDTELNVMFCEPAEDRLEPIFAAIHELGHWILEHPEAGEIIYPEQANSVREEDASYFALVMFCLAPMVSSDLYPRALTDEEIAKLGLWFLTDHFLHLPDVNREMGLIRSWFAASMVPTVSE
jgi:hypothetical protein